MNICELIQIEQVDRVTSTCVAGGGFGEYLRAIVEFDTHDIPATRKLYTRLDPPGEFLVHEL